MDPKRKAMWKRLVILLFAVFPAQMVRFAATSDQYPQNVEWLPLLRRLLPLITAIMILLPLVLEKKLLIYMESRKVESPTYGLLIYWLAFSISPVSLSSWLFLFGAPKTDVYYYAALSYAAGMSWSLWWYIKYGRGVGKKQL